MRIKERSTSSSASSSYLQVRLSKSDFARLFSFLSLLHSPAFYMKRAMAPRSTGLGIAFEMASCAAATAPSTVSCVRSAS